MPPGKKRQNTGRFALGENSKNNGGQGGGPPAPAPQTPETNEEKVIRIAQEAERARQAVKDAGVFESREWKIAVESENWWINETSMIFSERNELRCCAFFCGTRGGFEKSCINYLYRTHIILTSSTFPRGWLPPATPGRKNIRTVYHGLFIHSPPTCSPALTFP